MRRVRLILWNAAEAAQRASALERTGCTVDCSMPSGPVFLRELRSAPPDAVVIDLCRLPSQGRDVALALRRTAATRKVPIVFIKGEPEKTARVRDHLPDAVFTSWRGIKGALDRAVRRPPVDPVVPVSAFAGYSGTHLPKKLGVKEGMTVNLVGAPPDFRKTLGDLPPGVTLRGGATGAAALVVWFVRAQTELERGVARMAAAAAAPLWIAWPKKGRGAGPAASAARPTEKSVREAGLAAGLVDYKICAIDEKWSGLLFARRNR
jgi:CheY-like chemotaxis protein